MPGRILGQALALVHWAKRRWAVWARHAEQWRLARSMKELLVLLEDQLHARGINLHILSGICAGLHRPDGATIADKMLFMVAAMAAEMERDLLAA